jgi:hypothetical protein
MQAAGLNIVVTSNTQNAVSGINQVTNSLNNAGSAAASASSAVGNATTAINRLAPASSAAAAGITNLSRAINSGQASFAGVAPIAQQAARGYGVYRQSLFDTFSAQQQFAIAARNGTLTLSRVGQSAVSTARQVNTLPPAMNAANAAVSRFGNGSNRTGQAIMNFGRVLSDLPFGFIAIQNNIDPLLRSLGLGAGLGLAFTILGSLTTVAVQKYGSLSNAIKELTGTMTEADRAQKRFNDLMKEAGKSAGPQIAQLELLRSALLDINISEKERIGIVGEYNKVADKGNEISKTQINDLSAINRLINAQIELIGKRAIAQAAENKLGEEASKLLEVQTRTKPILDRVTNALLSQSSAAADAAKGVKALRLATPDEVKSDTAFQKSVTSQFTELAKIRSSPEFIAAEKELRLAQEEFNKQLGQIAGVVDIDGLIGPGSKKATKHIKDVSDVLKELEKNLLTTNALFVNSGDTLEKLTEDQISNYQNALASLIDIKILPGNTIFDQLKSRLDGLQQSIVKTKVDIPVNVNLRQGPQSDNSLFKKSLTEVQGLDKPLSIPIVVNPDFRINKATSNSLMTKKMGEALQATPFKPQVDKFTSSLNDLIQTSIEGGIGSISEALGNALVTGDFTGVIGGFVNAVAGFMQKLGVSLIATGIGLEAFKESLKNLNGFAAVAAGAALVVAAGAFRAIASGGIGSFATGGTAFGPQLALIGDNPQRKEHILSDNQLERIADGGGGELVGRFELDGNILSLAVQRSDRMRNRIN